MKPKVAAYGELIIPVFTQWERVGSITGILQGLELGIFYDAALLWDQMMRDDRIRASFNTRFMSVLGKPMNMEPAKDNGTHEKISDVATKLWPKMLPQSELITHLEYGYGLGASVARREWTRDGGKWIPSLKVWHPGALRFDTMTSTYMLRTQDYGEIPIVEDDPNWHLFTPFGHKYGRIKGMLRPLAMLYLCRQWAFRDRARHSETFGEPIKQLIVPAESDNADKQTARNAIAAIGTETVVVTPQGEDGNKFDLKFLEASSDGNKTFGPQIDHLDDCIAVFVLGQTSSTKGQGGLGAQEKPGDSVRDDIQRWDAERITDIGKGGVLEPWAEYNYGSSDKAPTPRIQVDPPEDGQKKAAELNTLADAISKLEKYGLDVRAVLEKTGQPMLSLEQANAKRAELEQKAADIASQADPKGDPKEPDSDDEDQKQTG